MGKWQMANAGRLLIVAVCLSAMGHSAGCCTEPSDTIERYGKPDIVYELRGATGRWYWFGNEPSPHPLDPDEIGFIWLDENLQAIFHDTCQTYSGPLRSDDWRRFEQDRTDQAEEAPEPS